MDARWARGFAAVVALAATATLTVPLEPAGAVGGPIAGWASKSIPVAANDIAYDPTRDVLVATVNGSDVSLGNELVELDPETGAVGRHVWVGSDPGPIALTDDGTMAYIGLGGAERIARVDLRTFTLAASFETRPEPGALVEDIEAAPGRNDLVVASLRSPFSSPRHVGVAAYEDDVALPVRTPGHTGANRIEFGSSAAELHGYNNETTGYQLYRLALGPTGVTIVSERRQVISGFHLELERSGARLYATSGQIVDAATHDPAGSFTASGPLEVTGDGRITFVSGTTVSIHDVVSGVPIESRSFPGIATARTLVASSTGLATTNGSAVTLLGPAVVSGAVALPPPPATTLDGFRVIDLPLPATALAADPTRARVYAVLPATSPQYPNEAVAIDPTSGAVTAHVWVGHGPGGLAVSDDGTRLYVALTGANRVVAVDLATFTVVGDFGLGDTANLGPAYAEDLAVQPGHPGVVAVALRNTCCSPAHEGVAVYDGGARRPDVTPRHTGPNRILFDGGSTLLGISLQSGSGLYPMQVDGAGVRRTSNPVTILNMVGGDIELAGPRLYNTTGQVLVPSTGRVLGRYGSSGRIEPVPALGRTYVLAGSTLHEFDLGRFRRIASRSLPISGTPIDLVGSGPNLVTATAGHVYVLTTSPEPPPASPIRFVAQATTTANATRHSVVIPSTVAAGDGLLLALSTNTSATIADPAGWQPLDTLALPSSTTRLWRRVATAADAGATVRVDLGAISKASLVVAAYGGTSTTDPVAGFARAGATLSTPTATAPAGAWAVSYWSHKDSTTTALAAPAGVTARAAGTQSGAGRVTTLLGDSDGPVAAGPSDGRSATGATPVANSGAWTVVLAPATTPPPPPPTTTTTATTIPTTTTTTTAPTTTTTTAPTTTITSLPPSPISFVGQASADGNRLSHSVVVPAGVQPGDGLLLLLTSNTSTGATGPAGWTSLGARTSTSSTTAAWQRVAVAGDAGATVRVDLGSLSKANLVVLAYRGTSANGPVASASTTVATLTTPTATAAPGSWVVSSWAHKDSATTALTPPGGVVPRSTGTQSGAGRVTTLVADSGPVPPGAVGGLAATGATPNANTYAATFVLAPG